MEEVKATYPVKTKGMEGVEVPMKERETIHWCESVERLSGKAWGILR